MLLGNDIVDLKTPRYHERFPLRVLSEVDRNHLSMHPESGDREIWLYWAAKEAAYKALNPAGLVESFRPKDFQVDLQSKRVLWKQLFELHLSFECNDDYVFCVCQEQGLEVRSHIEALESNDPMSESKTTLDVAERCLSKLYPTQHYDWRVHYSEVRSPMLSFLNDEDPLPLGFSHDRRYCAVSIPVVKTLRNKQQVF